MSLECNSFKVSLICTSIFITSFFVTLFARTNFLDDNNRISSPFTFSILYPLKFPLESVTISSGLITVLGNFFPINTFIFSNFSDLFTFLLKIFMMYLLYEYILPSPPSAINLFLLAISSNIIFHFPPLSIKVMSSLKNPPRSSFFLFNMLMNLINPHLFLLSTILLNFCSCSVPMM